MFAETDSWYVCMHVCKERTGHEGIVLAVVDQLGDGRIRDLHGELRAVVA